MRLSTGTRPKLIHSLSEQTVGIVIQNLSGANLYLSETRETANDENGILIAPNALFPQFLWKGELWIGSSVDNTEFRILKSPPIIIPEK